MDAPDEVLEGISFGKTVLIDEVFPDEFHLEETQERIETNTEELARYGKPMISVGGDHSVSYPVIKVLKRKNPEMRLVWLDAHLDVKEKVEGHVSHDVVVRQLVEEELFEPEEIYFVGITRIDDDERDYLEEKNFNLYRSDEVEEFQREFSPDEQPLYLSLDIDVLGGIEGTGYRDGELSMEEILRVIDSCNVLHADLVEAAPSLDEGETVEVAKELLQELVDAARTN